MLLESGAISLTVLNAVRRPLAQECGIYVIGSVVLTAVNMDAFDLKVDIKVNFFPRIKDMRT